MAPWLAPGWLAGCLLTYRPTDLLTNLPTLRPPIFHTHAHPSMRTRTRPQAASEAQKSARHAHAWAVGGGSGRGSATALFLLPPPSCLACPAARAWVSCVGHHRGAGRRLAAPDGRARSPRAGAVYTYSGGIRPMYASVRACVRACMRMAPGAGPLLARLCFGMCLTEPLADGRPLWMPPARP